MILPCHSAVGCLAPCCSVFCPWDRGSLKRLFRHYPKILEEKNAKLVAFIHERTNMHFIFPQEGVYRLFEDSLSMVNFNRLVKLKKDDKENAVHKCLFLKETRCSIYELRPSICAEFGLSEPCPWSLANLDKILDYRTSAS